MRTSVCLSLHVFMLASSLCAQQPTTRPAQQIASLAAPDAAFPPARQSGARPAIAPAIEPAQSQPAVWGEELSPADREAIRSLLALMRQACRSGDEICLADFMDPEEAKLARFVLSAERDHRIKTEELTRTARKAGIPLPGEVARSRSRLCALRDSRTPHQLRHPFLNDRAMAFGPAEPLLFRRSAKAWVFTLDLADGKAANSRIELSQAMAQATAELADGIADGTITADNFAHKHIRTMTRLVTPVVNQRMAFLVKHQ